MFELLFIFGALGWALGAAWEYLWTLRALPALLAGALVIPLLCWADFLNLLRRWDLASLERREPVPPERFYWDLRKARLRRTIWLLAALVPACWGAVMMSPPALSYQAASLAGWAAAAIAMPGTAHLLASGAIYVRASQWFDRMAPWAVGVCRRAMYRLSDNPDFLGWVDERKQEREKSVY